MFRKDIEIIYNIIQKQNLGELSVTNSDVMNSLYDCYTRGLINNDNQVSFSNTDSENFANKLITTFKEVNTTHYGWQLTDYIGDKEAIIIKRGRERRIKLAELKALAPIKLGSIVSFTMSNCNFINDNFFFHIRGNYIEGDNDFVTMRYYFNLNPKYVNDFLICIYNVFNKYQIPFHFKCIAELKNYYRKDNGVLYVSRRYFQIINEILKLIYSEIEHFINPEKVLFTKEFVKGISYAESPLNNESFGYTRCRDIVTASTAMSFENLLIELTNMGYDLENFHRNPNSYYLAYNES